MISASSDDQGQALLDLGIAWQSLIRDRAHARPGTQARADLDAVYYKVLPIVVNLTEAVSEEEINRLIKVVYNLLKQREGVS